MIPKWVTDLNLEVKTITILDESRKNLYNIGESKKIFFRISRAQSMEEQNGCIKCVFCLKDPVE